MAAHAMRSAALLLCACAAAGAAPPLRAGGAQGARRSRAVMEEGMVKACLQDEACVRRLVDELAGGNSSNSTNSTPTPPPQPQFAIQPKLVELMEANSTVDLSHLSSDRVVIGSYMGIRGLALGLDDGGNLAYGTWCAPIVTKVAMLFWANGLVVEPPPTLVLKNFSVVWADTCKDASTSKSPRCSAPYALQLAKTLFDGNSAMPPVKAVVGGSVFTQQVAQAAAAAAVPNLGWYSKSPDLSDKLSYPTFMRTIPTQALTFGATVKLLKTMGYTVADVVVCDTAESRPTGRNLLDLLVENSIAATQFLVPADPYTLFPAGHPGDIATIGEAASAKKKEAWDNIVKGMKAFNSHCHINLMESTSCPLMDVLSYLELEGGLAGGGHLWVADRDSFRLSSYEIDYFGGTQFLAPARTGYETPYRNAKTADGWIMVASDSELSQPNKDFWELMNAIGHHQDLLGPELAGKATAADFADRTDAFWVPRSMEFMADSLFAVFYAINAAMLEVGSSFTSTDVTERLRRTDFIGVTGRVKFDANGDRILKMEIQQYNLPAGLQQTAFGITGTVTTVGVYLEGNLSLTRPMVFYNGTTVPPPDRDLFCGVGNFYQRTRGVCLPCEPGTITAEDGLASCSACSPGSYANASGSSFCRPCQAGYASPDFGSTNCTPCEAGSFNEEVSQAQCRPCQEGTFSGEAAATCELCPPGRYAAGRFNANCTDCPAMLTTRFPGSNTDEDCLCSEGTYRRDEGEVCFPCPAGMDCPLGSEARKITAVVNGSCPVDNVDCAIPMASAGFMTRVSDPWRVFACLGVEECPGGPPGTCGLLRDPIEPACGTCIENAYVDGSTCKPCGDDSSLIPMIAAGIAAVGGVAYMSVSVNRDFMLQSHSMLSVAIIGGLTVSAVQTMGVFRSFSLEWFEPFASIYRICSLLSFNIDILRPSCAKASPEKSYVSRQFLAPGIAILLAAVIFVKKRVKKSIDAKVEYVNTLGTIFSAIFISIAISVVLPFVCYDHPDQRGSSMLSAPSILCYEDEAHNIIVAFAILALCFVLLPFCAVLTWATIKYTSFVAQANQGNSTMLKSFRFLFFRFHVDAYHYCLVLMARSLAICLVPVVIRNNAAAQVCASCSIILLAHTIQMSLQAWRTPVVNRVDGILNAGLVLFLVCGAAAFDFQAEESTIKFLGSFIMCSLSVAVVLAFGYVSVIQVRPMPWYHFFICHHKRDAAAQVRYLEALLAEQGKKVLVDSEDVRELDSLFNTAKSNIEHLVVYLTRDTLSKPWAAGEIATSVKKELKITKVVTPGFQPPPDEAFDDLSSYLELTGASVAQFDISLSTVAVAYKTLLSSTYPTITFSRQSFALESLRSIMSKLVSPDAYAHLSVSRSTVNLDSKLMPVMAPKMLVVSSDPLDTEASAAAGLLVYKFRDQVSKILPAGIFVLADAGNMEPEAMQEVVDMARCVVVVQSAGTLQSSAQLRLVSLLSARMIKDSESDTVFYMAGAIRKAGFAVVPVSLPNFSIPVQHYFTTVLPTLWPDGTQEDMKMVKLFFRWSSMPFATHAPMPVIVDHAQQIANTLANAVGEGRRLSTSASGPLDMDVELKARLSELSGDEEEVEPVDNRNKSQRSSSASSAPPTPDKRRSAADAEWLTDADLGDTYV